MIMKYKLLLVASISSVCLIVILYYQHNQGNVDDRSFWQISDEPNLASIDHSAWHEILQRYVDITHESQIYLFDYDNVDQEDTKLLNDYLNQLSAIDPRAYRRAEQKAYWINLYNALTVKLVLDNYPTESITKLGKKLTSFGPWDDKLIIIADKNLSLNDIEHKILRPIWQDARIHFAINCASYSCPNLQNKAFTGANMESLLKDAASQYLNHPRGIHFDNDTLVLSSIFDWYAEDFGADRTKIMAYLSQYLPEEVASKLNQYKGPIGYEYDWRLNDVDIFE